MKRIRIEKLSLRISGSVAGDVRSLAAAVGAETLRRLHRLHAADAGLPDSMDHLRVPVVRVPRDLSATQAIAGAVAGAVASQVAGSSR